MRKTWYTLNEEEELSLETSVFQLYHHQHELVQETLLEIEQEYTQEQGDELGRSTQDAFQYVGHGDRELQAYLDTQSQG